MRIEHFAVNVSEPVAMAEWYVAHLGMRIVRRVPGPALTHFLADGSGGLLEIYRNPPDSVPDYRSMDPLQLHIAFVSADPAADTARLLAAGASFVIEERKEDGTQLVMLRDPWGLSLQLCRRGTPFG